MSDQSNQDIRQKWQEEWLRQPVPKDHFDSRPQGGTSVNYLSGSYVIEIANNIFGPSGWSSQILHLSEDFFDYVNGKFSVGIFCLVRVIHSSGAFHEDIGYGTSTQGTKHMAISTARKNAITDAHKRALRLFGRRLGSSLKADSEKTPSTKLENEYQSQQAILSRRLVELKQQQQQQQQQQHQQQLQQLQLQHQYFSQSQQQHQQQLPQHPQLSQAISPLLPAPDRHNVPSFCVPSDQIDSLLNSATSPSILDTEASVYQAQRQQQQSTQRLARVLPAHSPQLPIPQQHAAITIPAHGGRSNTTTTTTTTNMTQTSFVGTNMTDDPSPAPPDCTTAAAIAIPVQNTKPNGGIVPITPKLASTTTTTTPQTILESGTDVVQEIKMGGATAHSAGGLYHRMGGLTSAPTGINTTAGTATAHSDQSSLGETPNTPTAATTTTTTATTNHSDAAPNNDVSFSPAPPPVAAPPAPLSVRSTATGSGSPSRPPTRKLYGRNTAPQNQPLPTPQTIAVIPPVEAPPQTGINQEPASLVSNNEMGESTSIAEVGRLEDQSSLTNPPVAVLSPKTESLASGIDQEVANPADHIPNETSAGSDSSANHDSIVPSLDGSFAVDDNDNDFFDDK